MMSNANWGHLYSAAVASAMKLKVIYEGSHTRGEAGYISRGYEAMLWSTVEHGLSIFASSLLALRPLMRLIPKGWMAFLSTISGSGGANSSDQSSSRRITKKPNWSNTTQSNELGRIGVQNSITVRSEYALDCHAQKPAYHAEVRSSSFESSDRLV